MPRSPETYRHSRRMFAKETLHYAKDTREAETLLDGEVRLRPTLRNIWPAHLHKSHNPKARAKIVKLARNN